jgi:hypothetical protein
LGTHATIAGRLGFFPRIAISLGTTYSSTCGEPTEEQRGPAPRSGHANYTTVEEIPTREEVLAGTFFLNERLIIILFDSRASHDFMSATCTRKDKLSLGASGAPYVINTPGGRVDVDHIVQKVPLNLDGRVFEIDLITLSGQGIDVILWMSWMKWHKVVLDIFARLVQMNSLVYGRVTLHIRVVLASWHPYITWLRGR